MKRVWLIATLVIILLLGLSVVAAGDTTEKTDVSIDPEDDETVSLFLANKGEKVDVKVTSDIPVNVYIIASGDYSYIDDDYSKAKKTVEGTTSTSFTYKIPDDQSYYLIIYNPSNSTTATVDYSYTDFLEKRAEEAVGFLGMAIGICIAIVIAVIVVIVLIIYFLIRSSSRKKQQQYPGYPPQQGYQQPPPGYPPQQPPQGQQPPPPPSGQRPPPPGY